MIASKKFKTSRKSTIKYKTTNACFIRALADVSTSTGSFSNIKCQAWEMCCKTTIYRSKPAIHGVAWDHSPNFQKIPRIAFQTRSAKSSQSFQTPAKVSATSLTYSTNKMPTFKSVSRLKSSTLVTSKQPTYLKGVSKAPGSNARKAQHEKARKYCRVPKIICSVGYRAREQC